MENILQIFLYQTKSHSEQSEESVEGTIPPSAALTPPFTQGRHNDSSA